VSALDEPTTPPVDGGRPPEPESEPADTEPAAAPHDDGPRLDEPAPGLKEQIGATRSAFQGLVGAHAELAKAEMGEIAGEVKRVAAFVGIAVGLFVLAALLVGVGLFLWLAEWLFGSMGWALLHGPLLLAGIAIAAILGALGYGGGRIGGNFIVAAFVGILVGVVLGLDLTNRGWTALGDAIATNIPADIRPLVVAASALGILFAIGGLLLGGRSGGMGGAIGGALPGLILGALLGALTSVALGPQAGAAIGLTVGLATWTILMGAGVAREGIDTDALKARFWPDQTIETTKETIEWVRERTPLGPKS
jgi:hypothetical protein